MAAKTAATADVRTCSQACYELFACGLLQCSPHMKTAKLLIMVVFLSICRSALAQTEPLIIGLGEKARIKSSAARIWIADPKILKAEWDGRGFVLSPKKTGAVDIRLAGELRKVFVWTPSAMRTRPVLEKIISKMPGLSVIPGERASILKGTLYRLKDLEQIVSALPLDSHWELQAEHDHEVLSAWIAQQTRAAGQGAHPLLRFPFLHTRIKGKNLSLEKTLNRLGVAVLEDSDAVVSAPVVRVEIAVAEVRKDNAAALGISPSGGAYQATLLPTGKWEASPFSLSFNAFESEGHARILARPNLICRSGAEAEFLAGGEFPIKLLNERINDVVWKRYGIILKVKPLADRTGRISLKLETEISTIDPSTEADGLPAMLTNRVSSHFDLIGPRTIALSGLLRHEESLSKNGIFGLSSIPILGTLFSSRAWKEKRSELVIFVRPEIISEGTP